eukprot:GHVU01019232.1.p1 GENE.GHVU01019232.1~~GHVU01019232.1.p1  ORF type:complete len:214 (+),score=32.80 GHVU01019232.1:371-1012(+)
MPAQRRADESCDDTDRNTLSVFQSLTKVVSRRRILERKSRLFSSKITVVVLSPQNVRFFDLDSAFDTEYLIASSDLTSGLALNPTHAAQWMYLSSTIFATGSLYNPAMLHNLICHSRCLGSSCVGLNAWQLLVSVDSSNAKRKETLEIMQLEGVHEGTLFGEFFKFVVRETRVIPIGLFRGGEFPKWGRFVITNPEATLPLRENDFVYVIRPA